MATRVVGLVIVAVGVAFLLANFGIIPEFEWGELLATWWPVLLIYGGLHSIWDSLRKGYGPFNMGGILILVIGGLLLADNLDTIEVSLWGVLVPAALIVVGLSLLFGRTSKRRIVTSIKFDEDIDAEFAKPVGARHIKSYVGDIRLGGPTFQLEDSHVELKAGSMRIDLTETFIPEGETVLHLEVKAGDCQVRLPEGLAVAVDAQVKVGSLRLPNSDGSNGSLSFVSQNYAEAERKVKLYIYVKIGDIHVTQF